MNVCEDIVHLHPFALNLTVYVFAFDCAWIDTALSGIVNIYGFDVEESTSSLLYVVKWYHVLGVAERVTSAPHSYLLSWYGAEIFTDWIQLSADVVTVYEFLS